LEKRAEQVLPGSKGGGGEKESVGGKVNKCPKQCLHIRINELKKQNIKDIKYIPEIGTIYKF
jgi:hypothetical protein